MTTTVGELVDLLLRSGSTDPSTQAALAHLRASESATKVPESKVARAELYKIYQRRLRGLPPDVVGLEAVVDGLDSVRAVSVLLAVHVGQDTVTTVVRGVDSTLIGCVVGPDRREREGATSSDPSDEAMPSGSRGSWVEAYARCMDGEFFTGAMCPRDGHSNPTSISLSRVVGAIRAGGELVNFDRLRTYGFEGSLEDVIVVEFADRTMAPDWFRPNG